MSFEDAVPVSRIAYGRDVDFDLGSRAGTGNGAKGRSKERRQSVNISEDTLLKVARTKLGRMVDIRRGYNQSGAIEVGPAVGSLLSAKA